MPRPPTLKITEIFPSFQGEGLRQGEATIFVRLSGCNLKCPFCDTKYAWKGGRDYSAEEVLEKIKEIRVDFPARWICLTGGEPLIQEVSGLVRKLKKEGFRVQVETNGTFYRHLPVDWYSVSPKPAKYRYRPEYRQRAKEVKLIVTKDLEFKAIRKLRKEFPEKTPLLLQPQSARIWSMALATRLLKQAVREGLKNTRLSYQLHKIYGFR
jgi:organic radical activating enzyme